MNKDALTTPTPTSIEMRAPWITRERTSRPNSSVPNQCADEGGFRREGRSIVAGSWGAIHGANKAKHTKIVTITAPAIASGLCLVPRRPLVKLKAGLAIQLMIIE